MGDRQKAEWWGLGMLLHFRHHLKEAEISLRSHEQVVNELEAKREELRRTAAGFRLRTEALVESIHQDLSSAKSPQEEEHFRAQLDSLHDSYSSLNNIASETDRRFNEQQTAVARWKSTVNRFRWTVRAFTLMYVLLYATFVSFGFIAAKSAVDSGFLDFFVRLAWKDGSFSQFRATVFIMLLGLLLFGLRRWFRRVYAGLELVVAAIVAYQAARALDPSIITADTIIAMSGAVYLVVRGLDNFEKGHEEAVKRTANGKPERESDGDKAPPPAVVAEAK